MRRKVLIISLLAIIGVFAYFANYLLSDSMENMSYEKTYDEIQKIALKTNVDIYGGDSASESSEVDFAALLEINPDTVAWIEIPGTSINYPVVRGKDDFYYEKRDFNKKPASCGAIFAHSGNSFPEPFDDNTVIYGHNMSSSSTLMFSPLRNYKDSGFMKEHNTVNLYTPTGRSRWRIAAVCHLSIDVLNQDFNFLQIQFEDDEAYEGHIAQLEKRAMHTDNLETNDQRELLTLITCDRKKFGKKGRLLVVAVREG